jgi:hypothetical protein
LISPGVYAMHDGTCLEVPLGESQRLVGTVGGAGVAVLRIAEGPCRKQQRTRTTSQHLDATAGTGAAR